MVVSILCVRPCSIVRRDLSLWQRPTLLRFIHISALTLLLGFGFWTRQLLKTRYFCIRCLKNFLDRILHTYGNNFRFSGWTSGQDMLFHVWCWLNLTFFLGLVAAQLDDSMRHSLPCQLWPCIHMCTIAFLCPFAFYTFLCHVQNSSPLSHYSLCLRRSNSDTCACRCCRYRPIALPAWATAFYRALYTEDTFIKGH